MFRFRCRLKRKGTPAYIWALCFAKISCTASGKTKGFNGYAVDIRDKSPLSLILCDLDFFKHFNDTYGHQAGDDCLKKVAAAIDKNVCRTNDLVTRYGGEEFAAILPNTGIQGAEVIAERIRSAMHNLHIAHNTSPVSRYVSLSLGIGTYIPEQGAYEDILVAMADKALYRSKAMGRNKCCVYDPLCDGGSHN